MNSRRGRDRRKKRHPLLKALVALGIVFSAVLYRMPSKEKKKFTNKLKTGLHNVGDIFVEYCIPHERNGYRPKALHHRSVHTILLFVVLVKIGLLSVLFTLYPNLARFDQDIQSGTYNLINQYRVEKGSQPLAVNHYLEEAALLKGQDMLASSYFSHFGPDGKKPWQWLDPGQYSFKAMGENLAMDFLSANSVVRAFQKSPSHDRNLLNTAYTEVGVVVLNGYLDGHTTNLMVVFFASPKASAIVATSPTTPESTAPVESQVVVKTPQTTPPTSTQTTTTVTEPANVAVAQQNAPTSTAVLQVPSSFTLHQVNSGNSSTTEVLGESVGNDQFAVSDNFQGGVIFSQGTVIQRVVAWTDRFFYAFLVAAILLLLVNIFVKIRIQHAPTIANGVLLIAVTAIALFAHIHHAEAIGEQVRVLAEMLIRY